MPRNKILAGGIIIAAIAGIIGIIVASNYFNSRQVTTNTRAEVSSERNPAGTKDSCGHIHITSKENTACPIISWELDAQGKPVPANNATRNLSEYSTTFIFTNLTDQPRTIKYHKMGFFCEEPWGQATTANAEAGKYRTYCVGPDVNNPQISEFETVTIPPKGKHEVTVVVKNDSANRCGSFQSDMAYGSFQTDVALLSVDGNDSCSFPPKGQEAAYGYVAEWGMCQTGLAFPGCKATPTPAPQVKAPPTLELDEPGNVCIEENTQISASGRPGGYDEDSLNYKVILINKDKSNFEADDCPGEVSGPYCTVAESTNPLFNVDIEGLVEGDYQIFAQVEDSQNKILCSNDPIKPFEVKCARTCQ